MTLRAAALGSAFAARGIEVQIEQGTQAERVFLRARRHGDDLIVPAHLREQMLRELMSVQSFVAIVDEMLTAIHRGAPAEAQRIVVCDEREAWLQAGERS